MLGDAEPARRGGRCAGAGVAGGLLLVAWLLIALPAVRDARAAGPASPGEQETATRIQQLERRIADLEALVRSMAAGQRSVEPVTAPAPVGAVPERSPGLRPVSAAQPRPEDKDDWEEALPHREGVGGRDEEARRRLGELETWKRKQEARAAKEAEEAAERTRFEVSARYKLRLNARDNLDLGNPRQSWEFDDQVYFDQRFQLRVDAEYGPFAAVLVLDKGNFVFDWKEDSEGTLDRWSTFLTVHPALVRELYAQFTGDVVVKAGRQNIVAGNGGLVLEGPMDALRLTYPFGETALGRLAASAAYIAVAGGFRSYADFRRTGPPAGDRSTVLGAENHLHAGLVSLDVRPRQDLTVQPYLLKVLDTGSAGDPDLNLDKDFDAATAPRDGGFEPLWLGIAVSGKAGNLAYTADAIYLGGSFTDARDLSAYALMLRGDYRVGDVGPLRNLSLGLEFGRGSGDTAEDKLSGGGDAHDFIGLFLCHERRKFGNIFSEDLRAGYFLADSSLANVTFVRALLGVEPIPRVKVSAAVARLWTTEAVFRGRGPVRDWSAGASLTTRKTRDIGWELDLNMEVLLHKRLRAFAELGYFIPGAVYHPAGGRGPDAASEVVLGAEVEF